MPKKKKTDIVIPGDSPKAVKELLRIMDRNSLAYLEFEMEKIRTSDMTEDQKHIARSKISWRIDALRRSILERS